MKFFCQNKGMVTIFECLYSPSPIEGPYDIRFQFSQLLFNEVPHFTKLRAALQDLKGIFVGFDMQFLLSL